MLRLGRFAVQRRGTIFDVWTHYKRRHAVVICMHGKMWPEGGIGCSRCVRRWKRKANITVVGVGRRG